MALVVNAVCVAASIFYIICVLRTNAMICVSRRDGDRNGPIISAPTLIMTSPPIGMR